VRASALLDAVALEEKLSRLPPAQPCPRCPSRDASGKLVLIHPVLVTRADGADCAQLHCTLCGSDDAQPLR
jgi:hypothetical protein